MGHREQLIEGAKKCLSELGYARTTARDIVAASGTNLASIGYHFGSKDALLTEAMVESMGEWGDEVERVLSDAWKPDPADRLEAMWAGLISSFQANRGMWTSSFEIMMEVERNPVLRERLTVAYDMARAGLACIFLGVEQVDEVTKWTVGTPLVAMVPGLFCQWIVDPDRLPPAKDIAAGMKRIAQILSSAS